MNNVSLIGRLTHEPELRFTQGGLAVNKLIIAVDRSLGREKRDELRRQGKPTADFPRVVAMGKLAETCQLYLKKGDMFSVEGRVSTSSYENKDGGKVFTTDIIASHIRFLSNNKHAAESAAIELVAEETIESAPF
ncbi:single-stranded DNA-binding protein [Acidaminobacter hydrogenoformans]|uniref:Single-stranded DNA-binding protein n=1 Tax=Acidaminobacter hydrogenoformans DSM 2784 TaxID=1120920 RepID=A0A1G5S531_9FIRM|nr:single-stranded DNA-binding protein [Acidaminobacter hydrogenoformans]SCZ81512.1 single-strand DNA-binding protein [Acidaminobacter hydrogenoformans DSM 2784]